MPKAAYLLGILATTITLLSACTNNSPEATSMPAPVSDQQSAATIEQQAEPQTQKATFAASPTPLTANLTEPTSKAKRQQELAARLNYNDHVGRDPFTTLPGSLNLPTVNIPAPIQPPFALSPVTPPKPLVAKQPTTSAPKISYTPPRKEAEVMTISGAVEIGGDRYAIVSIPGETSSQYVRVGQKVARDKVLVKHIDMSGTPRVILQQNGVEFVRYVGSSGN